MNHPKLRQLHGIDPQDAIDDAQCPNCESNNMTDRGHTCNDCDWSMPNLSFSEKPIRDYPDVYVCDHCNETLGPNTTLCEDCLVSEGLKTGDVEVLAD